MKRLLLLILVIFSINTYSQQNSLSLNLPPGYKLHPKKKIIDLSYKLDFNSNDGHNHTESDLKFLKKISDADLNLMKTSNPDYYNYIQNGTNYIGSLSTKVKEMYTNDELWYIYAFDQNLKNRLTTL